jgi:hypothetical protein
MAHLGLFDIVQIGAENLPPAQLAITGATDRLGRGIVLNAGPGVYWRPVHVTTPGVGYVPGYCDPWWYVCYPGGFVPVDYIIGERTSTDFGINFGGGVNFSVGEHVKIYAEARYHYIWGPEVKNPVTGESRGKANGQFLPLTFGVRF